MSAERVKAEHRPIATELRMRTGVSGCCNTTDIDGELARDDSQTGKTQMSLDVATLKSPGSSKWIKFISAELMRESIRENEFTAFPTRNPN